MEAEVLSLGHSSLPMDRFLRLLLEAGATAVADVRSVPWSRRNPQYCAESLRASLAEEGIAYVPMGEQLGGRPSEERLFLADGAVDYEAMAAEPAFQEGIERVSRGAQRHRIALVCSEAHPLDCHRCLLVGRALLARGVDTAHLLHDGTALTQSAAEDALLKGAGLAADDLLRTREERLREAYARRATRIGYRKPAEAGGPAWHA